MKFVNTLEELKDLCTTQPDLHKLLKLRAPFYLFENELDRLGLSLSAVLRSTLKNSTGWRSKVLLTEKAA